MITSSKNYIKKQQQQQKNQNKQTDRTLGQMVKASYAEKNHM